MRTITIGRVCACALLVCQAQAQIVTGVQVTTGPNGTTTQTTMASGPAATSAQAAATSAQISAATAEVPGSGIAPTTTAGTGAGTEEGALLVAVESRLAAQYLTNSVLVGKTNVLVFVGGTAVPDVSPWLYFQNETSRLSANIDAHKKALEAEIDKKTPVVRTFIAALPLALILAPKILSYGYTSFSTAGASLVPDDYMLDVALLKYAPSWRLYAQQIGQTLPSAVALTLDKLDTANVAASADIVVAQRLLAVMANDPKAKDSKPAGEIAQLTAAIANLTGDLTNYNSFLTALNTATSASSWSNVLQAYAFSRALDSATGGGVAFIKVHSTAVGVVTKSNLWTNLDLEPPMYISVGMVVSFVFYDTQTATSSGSLPGAQLAPLTLTPTRAGLFEVRTHYKKAKSIEKALTEDSLGHCTLAAPAAGSDAAKYCPVVYPDH